MFSVHRVQAVFIAVLLCILANSPVWAQAPDDTSLFANPYPESGRWFANDGSRTGLFIEVQNGFVAGLYVGADGSGDNVWLTFSGPLQGLVSTDARGGWILDADLLQFSGVGCILECQGALSSESMFEVVGEIRVAFPGRNEGQVSINGAEPKAIAPIFFGVASQQIRAKNPPRFLPDLEGQWVVASASSSGFPQSIIGSTVVTLGPRTSENLPVLAAAPPGTVVEIIRHPIVQDTAGRFPEDSVIECNRFASAGERPTCFVMVPQGSMTMFSIDFGSISDARFTVIEPFDEGDDGVQHTFMRLNHD